MKTLKFSFETKNSFTAPVTEHQFALRCAPLADAAQRVLECETQLSPALPVRWQADGFGNPILWGSLNAPHTHLHYGTRGAVQVDLAARVAAPPHPMYRRPGALTVPGPQIQKLFAALPVRGQAPAQTAALLCSVVHATLHYTPGSTGVATTAEQALAQNAGVCQDYAQLYLALARLAGLPARYCMGLTIGEGATHAWAEVWLDGLWCGFDPTRGCEAGEGYLRFAVGRDAADCPVERGVFRGSCGQAQTVFMRVAQA